MDKFEWRCAKCQTHLSSIIEAKGIFELGKKCPRCKSSNQIKLFDRTILIKCKLFDPLMNGYNGEFEQSFTNTIY